MIRKFCLILAVLSTASFSMVSAQQTAKVTASGIGYLEYLPQGYHSNSNKYPVVISLHGIKEKGTSSNDRNRILADLHKVDNVGLPKYVKFGQKYPFILISPQLKNNHGTWPADYVIEVLNHVKKTLRIDDRRIYLTGLSLGGFGVWRTAGAYPNVFAAILPICPGGNAMGTANDLAAQNVGVWGFHGGNDRVVSHRVTTNMVNAINSAPKKPNPLAKATIFPGAGHIIWDKAYKQTNSLTWLLNHRKGSAPKPTAPDEEPVEDNTDDEDDTDKDEENKANKAPVVRLGGERSVNLPANSIQIPASASDTDGKIVSYQWTKIAGGHVRLSGTNSSRLSASDLRAGVYQFRLTVKDNDGAVQSGAVKVIVRKSSNDNKPDGKTDDNKGNSRNLRPSANAGPDLVITKPRDWVNIQARANDKDGKVVSYEWTQTYSTHNIRAAINGQGNSSVRISNLKGGVYIFRLRVRDNDDAVRDDYFKVTVKDRR